MRNLCSGSCQPSHRSGFSVLSKRPPLSSPSSVLKYNMKYVYGGHTSWFMMDLPEQESGDVSIGDLISESWESQGVPGLWTPLTAVSCERSS